MMMLMYGGGLNQLDSSNCDYLPHPSFSQGIPAPLRMMEPMNFRPPLQESNENTMISLSIPSCLPFHYRNWVSLLASDFRKAENAAYVTTPNRLAFLRYTADEVMRETCTTIQILGPSNSSFSLISLPSHYNITLWGPYKSVKYALHLLQNKAQLYQFKQTIHLPIHLIPNHIQIKEIVEEIANGFGVLSQWYHERTSADEYTFELFGSSDILRKARLAILLAFDKYSDWKEMVYTLNSEDHSSLITLIAGPHRHQISKWISEYDAHIYLPPAYQFLESASTEKNIESDENRKIYITASSSGKLSALCEIINTEVAKANRVLKYKLLNCSIRKLDLLLNEKPYAFESVLISHGCYATVKILDPESYSLSIYSTSSMHLEGCLHELYDLFSEYQTAELAVSYCPSFLETSTTSLPLISQYSSLSHISNSGSLSTSSTESSSLQFKGFNEDIDSLRRISQTTGLEIIYANGFIELFGRTEQVIAGLNICQSCNWISSSSTSLLQVKFQFVQPAEVTEFVCGKKDGKLNKIMRSTGTLVTMEGGTGGGPDWSVNICIHADSIMSALESLDMVQGELPADLSFYIPEIHHKRIIGHGGKNIQKIMKSFGVYVKFLNNDEVRIKYGLTSPEVEKEIWPLSREYYANVLVKTPSKNSAALEQMKRAILELSGERDLTPINDFILVPSHYQNWMLRQQSKLEELEQLTQVQVYWPPLEWQFDEIQLKGSPFKLIHAKQLLVEMMPAYSCFYIEPLVHIENVFVEYFKNSASGEWQDLKKKVLKDWKVKIIGPSESLLSLKQNSIGITALVSQALGPNLTNVYTFIKESLKPRKMVVMGSANRGQKSSTSRRNSYHFTKDVHKSNGLDQQEKASEMKRTIKSDSMMQRSRSQSFGEAGMTHESFRHFNSVLFPSSGNRLSLLYGIKVKPIERNAVFDVSDRYIQKSLISPNGIIGERNKSQHFINHSSLSSDLEIAINNGFHSTSDDSAINSFSSSYSTSSDDYMNGGELVRRHSLWGVSERRTSLVDGLEITDEEKKRHATLFIGSISEWKTPILGERVLEPPPSPISPSLFSLRLKNNNDEQVPSADLNSEEFENLNHLLKSLQLDDKYLELFIEKNINLEDLIKFSDEDLKDLGIIPFTARKNLLKRLEDWKFGSYHKSMNDEFRMSKQHRRRRSQSRPAPSTVRMFMMNE